jgi:hypothetical protein
LWASLSSATLNFKQPLHQLGELFHDFLQGWEDWLFGTNDRGSQGRKLVKSVQFSVFLEARSFRGVPHPCAPFAQEPALSGAEGVGILTSAALSPLPNPASTKLVYVSLADAP